MDDEEVWKETSTTRTAAQVAARQKQDLRRPPNNWSNTKYFLNTYAPLLHALFTGECPHFKAVWAMRNTLVGLHDQRQFVKPQHCVLIVFKVLKDARQFYAKCLMPKHFQVADPLHVPWPATTLTTTATLVRELQFGALESADFPHQWMPKAEQDSKRASGEQLGRTGGGPRDWNVGGFQKSIHQQNQQQSQYQQQLDPRYQQQQHNQYQQHQQGLGQMPPLAHSIVPLPIRGQVGQLLDNLRHLKPSAKLRDLVQFGDLKLH